MATFGITALLLFIALTIAIGLMARQDRRQHWLLGLFGGSLLFSSWAILYWLEWLFTEAHLVGYYCCVTTQDLPALGTVERTTSDFFRTSLGGHLPALLFTSMSLGITFRRLRHHHSVPAILNILIIANFLYLVLDTIFISLGWSIAGWIQGPQLTPYKGFDRSIYGITFHALLWLVYFWTIARLQLPPLKMQPWRRSLRITGY